MKRRIILRADGNTTIGLGHVYRLLALADMLRADYQIAFAIAKPDDFLKDTIRQYVHEIVELPLVFTYISPFLKLPDEEMPFDLMNIIEGTEIVVTDGYWFGTNYQRAVKKTGAKLICVDDLAETYFVADAVLNHAPGIFAQQYRGESYTKYYLGLDYALLRKDFFNTFSQKRNDESVLIGLGGTDQCEITGKVLDVVIRSDFFSQIHVLISPLFSEKQKHYLESVSREHPQRVALYENLGASQLTSLMDNCEYAIVSASTVLIECYSRGLICFTGFYTNNQLNVYKGFVSQKMAFGWGDFNSFDVNLRSDEIKALLKSPKIKPAIRPLNSPRNIRFIFEFNNEGVKLELREATILDCQMLFEWANDFDVRKNSINSNQIRWEEHQCWFRKKIESKNSKLFILETDDNPIGQIRFDYKEDNWIIDYSVSSKARGNGFGKLIIKEGIKSFPIPNSFIAYVKSDNIASISVFNSLGFVNCGFELLNDVKMIKYLFRSKKDEKILFDTTH